MFDELDKNVPNTISPASPSVPPVGGAVKEASALKVGPQDIFAEVDQSGKPEAFKPKVAAPGAPYSTVIPGEYTWKNNKTVIFGLLFGGLIIIIGGGYLGLKFMANKNAAPAQESAAQESVQTPAITPEVVAPEVVPPAVNQEINNQAGQAVQPVITPPVDSDLDGLTDEEEATLGTSSDNPDTDGDGLTDREEARVYGTDPLKADTDGDGYADGQEVKNGFNPKGAGKLNVIDETTTR